jgi:hypothetical protein
MQRKMAPYAIAASVVLALGVPAAGSSSIPAPGAGFTVRAYVSPNPVPYGAYPTLYARTTTGAVCTASVVYSTCDRSPASFG